MPKYICSDNNASGSPFTISSMRGPFDSIEEAIKATIRELENEKHSDKNNCFDFRNNNNIPLPNLFLSLLTQYIQSYKNNKLNIEGFAKRNFKIYEIFQDKPPKLISQNIIVKILEPILYEYEVMLTDI